MESPNRIYYIHNVDEMGIPLNHSAPKIVTRRGQSKVRYRTSGNKSQVTIMMFDSKSLNMEWRKDEVPSTSYGLSNKGWVDTELFRAGLPTISLSMQLELNPY